MYRLTCVFRQEVFFMHISLNILDIDKPDILRNAILVYLNDF